MEDHNPSSPSLRYLTQLGEDFYFDELKDKLEKTDFGKYVVIEAESKKYFVHEDLLEALNEAEEEFPEKFFTIIKIGSLQLPATNYRKNIEHAWPL
jgi:hypothetical protein